MNTRADIANESNRKLYQNHLASMAKLREARLRIEALERELAEERASREQAAAKAWEFADRIKELENQVERLRSAMDDIVSYVSRADYYYMEPATLEVLREINGGGNGG